MAAAMVPAFPPMTLEEEDAVILTRITNDERPLRRLLKKFHLYISAAYKPLDAPSLPGDSAMAETQEAFLLELATISLQLGKNALVCEAETRQVEEYERETGKIANEHEILRGQIAQLKTALEDAQLLRRRKIEYDQVAERITTLPSRDELEETIAALENDMAAIRAEHDMQDQELQQRRIALQKIVLDVTTLRLLGREDDADADGSTPLAAGDADMETTDDAPQNSGDRDTSGTPVSSAQKLNPSAATFVPRSSPNPRSTSTELAEEREEGEEDIEMGEVSEEPTVAKEPKSKKKPRDEELEEGEASDLSSELSEPPEE